MKVDNPVSSEFLLQYPVEAARVLEHVSVENVAALFTQLSSGTSVPVLNAMLPNFAAACLEKMAPSHATALLTEMPVAHAAYIFRFLSPSMQQELSALLSDKVRSRIFRYLDYIPLSAGDLMQTTFTMLPEDLTVADAIHRIERMRYSVGCEIYITDNMHHFTGVLELGKLMVSNHHARLRDMRIKKTPSISAHATVDNLLSHPGWETHRSLPVVERDNTLVGVLDYTQIREVTAEKASGANDPLQNLLSLAGLYWLSLSQLLDSILSITHADKGQRQ